MGIGRYRTHLTRLIPSAANWVPCLRGTYTTSKKSLPSGKLMNYNGSYYLITIDICMKLRKATRLSTEMYTA